MIEIFEGPKVKVNSIDFVGNNFASDAMLRIKIATRTPILGLFGRYHGEMLDEDRQKLIEYYQSQGFFEAKVTPVTRPGSEPGKIDVTFVVSEGTRYKVRNVIIEGNTKLKTEKLREDLELHSGKPFMMVVKEADKNRMLIKYGEIGCIDSEIVCEPRFTNQLGVVDLVYKIVENEPYMLGELKIQGNARTKDKVIRREAVMAGLLPGEVLDKTRIEIFRRRLTNLQYFMNDPKQGKQIKLEIANRREKDKPYGDLMMPVTEEVSRRRGCKTRVQARTSCRHPNHNRLRTAREPPPSPMFRGCRHSAAIRLAHRPIQYRRSKCPRPATDAPSGARTGRRTAPARQSWATSPRRRRTARLASEPSRHQYDRRRARS